MNFLKHLFTEADGKSYDVVPVLGALSVIMAMIFQGYTVFHSGTFDILNFATGIGTLLVAIGGGMKLKPPSISNGS
jgi:hypothetical protein